MDNIENVILRNLIYNEEYTKKVLPYLNVDYFINKTDKEIYTATIDFVNKYATLPTLEAIKIILTQKISNPEVLEPINIALNNFEKDKDIKNQEDWLLDQTEKFCQENAIKLAIIESLEILENKKGSKDKGLIPSLLTDALAISFNAGCGHDYLEDADERFAFYHKKEHKIEFDIDWLNTITNGGIPPKTLNMVLAGINVGKTLTLCHLAAHYLSQGLNVFYASGEMAEEELAKRIDANLFDLNLDDIINIPKNIYDNKINKLKSKTHGKLIIEEYSTGTSTVINIRASLHELLLKKNFKPDIIIIDYIGVFASSRIKAGAAGGLYVLGKAIAEEFRGLAQEYNARLWTAVQFNRSGYKSSDPGMGDIGESFAIAMTADFAFGLITNDALEEQLQYLASQIKNRYGDVTKYKKSLIGVSRAKQKLYNIDISEQEKMVDVEELPEIDSDRKSKFGKFKF